MVPLHIQNPQVISSTMPTRPNVKNPHAQFIEKLRDGGWGSSGIFTYLLWISFFFVYTLTWEMLSTLKDFQMNVAAGLQTVLFWRIVHRHKNMILTLQNSNIQS